MTTQAQKTMKKKKRRTPRKSKEYFVRGKTGKHRCAVCGLELHGVPHGKRVAAIGKMSKTEKRPCVPFGGTLCGRCRRAVAEEKAKLESGLKEFGSIDFKLRKFIAVEGAGK